MLEALIASILKCELDSSIIKDVLIIVVDNDENKSGEATITKFKNSNKNYNFRYSVQPNKGLANVRNELLKKALGTPSDYIVFIDDDEFVTATWLNELVKAIVTNKAEAIRGPVLAVKNAEISKYIWCWFTREQYPNNTQLSTLTTGNLILNRHALEKYNVWFDTRFNLSGSEDHYFGIQLLNKGAKIFWTSKAIAYETIPKSRGNLKWLLQRKYRVSNTYSLMLKLEHKYLLLIKKILVSIVYIIFGSATLFIALSNYKKKYWCFLKIAEGLGGLSGAFSLGYSEYK